MSNDFTDVDKLCSTRRSAGLPYLVTAIVATESTNGTESALDRTFGLLLDVDMHGLRSLQ
jgi:hypothetical protein